MRAFQTLTKRSLSRLPVPDVTRLFLLVATCCAWAVHVKVLHNVLRILSPVHCSFTVVRVEPTGALELHTPRIEYSLYFQLVCVILICGAARRANLK